MQLIVTPELPTEPINRDVTRLCITDFASLPDKTIIDQTKLAEILGVTTRTIRRMVSRYELPEPIRFGGHSVWTVGVIVEYVNANLQKGACKSRKNLLAIGNS